ncbi:MAG: FtsX-like permease family protein [Actinomycetota bacterium]
MWRATLKSLLARKVRLLLTAIAVVLGVGFVAGTYVLTDTLNAAFDTLFATSTAAVDVQVQGVSAFDAQQGGPGGGGGSEREPVPESVVTSVQGVAGVAQVVGNVQGYAQIVDPATGDAVSPAGAPTIGSSWTPLAGLIVVQGHEPRNGGEVAVDAGTAAAHDLAVGQTITVLLQGPPRDFAISGIVRIGDTDSLLGATLTVFDLGTAQQVMDRAGVYDYLSVVADDGVSAVSLRDRVTEVLPKGFQAVTGADAAQEAADQVSEGLGFLKTFLLVFALVSLFVGSFIIFNTFNIIVTQRVRELGLLRALGATRRQILLSVVAESFVTGALASAVGIGAGIGIAIGLQWLLKSVGVELPSTATKILPRTVIVSLVLGTVVTVAAAIFPARRAARVAPIEAMRESGGVPPSSLRRRALSGGIVSALGVGLLGAGLFGKPSNAAAVVGAGAAVTFLGVAILSPLFARPLAAWIGAPFRGGALPGRLGRENAMRNPRRTASTASALMIGLGLVTFVAVAGASLKASAGAALDRVIRSDFIVSTTSFSPFGPQVVADLAADPSFGAVSAIRQGQAKVGASTAFLAGTDPATIGQVVNLEFRSGALDALRTSGSILIYQGVADSKGLAIGDQISVEFSRTGTQTFSVGGVYTDNSILNDYAISVADYQRNFSQQLDSIAFATIAPGVSTQEAAGAIERITAAYPNIKVQNQAEFKATQANAIDSFLALVSVLLLMAIVIALFGIVNTLRLSIYERIREIGLLRAVGMSRLQVRRMIRVESVIIAILGALLGVAVGIAFGIAMQRALVGVGVTELAIPVRQLLLYVLVAALAGVVAAILPARRAAKLDVLQAISYE